MSFEPLSWNRGLLNNKSFQQDQTFTFLNTSHQFKTVIDWNYNGYGKLWTYNLNYFDFLHQKEMPVNDSLRLINNYIQNRTILKDGLEPYPVSLRGINWIKFLSNHNCSNREIDQSLYNDFQRLSKNLEYHLLGNHLLENACALFFGAYYFKDEKMYNKSAAILKEELNEQVLADGAHFELSPMYHQILLGRLLDCINLAKLNRWMHDDLIYFLQRKAVKMLGWLQTVTYTNGDIPMVNDSAHGIAPSSDQLFDYAKTIGLSWETSILETSGYRKFKGLNYECFMDVGNIGPNYIPGHAHADTFSFELYVKEQPCIVDTGISTYEKNETRQSERSTMSHNTVVVNEKNQSDVWGGFRVGKRAKIIKLTEKKDEIIAAHDGYKNSGLIHERRFTKRCSAVEIEDTLVGKRVSAVAYFHLHPSITDIDLNQSHASVSTHGFKMNFTAQELNIAKSSYNFAKGFNMTQKAIVLQVSFKQDLLTTIELEA